MQTDWPGRDVAVFTWLYDDLKDKGADTTKTLIYFFNESHITAINSWLGPAHHLYLNGDTRDQKKRFVQAYYPNAGNITKDYVLTEFVKANSIIRIVICTVAFGLGKFYNTGIYEGF